ncbi:hypothetical protein [Hymenobacter sp. B81]|uniref:hypothetical protein n=1 Tax=Hymenobacter sp. B81 TaxID=3344878 RepID=UPI0037DD88A8
MEPKSQPKPAQPNPADNSLPTKGTPDTQSADAVNPTNVPRPDSAAGAPPAPAATPEADAETPESQAARQAAPAADPSAADVQPDTSGDADPGASNTSDVRPL